MADNDVVPEGVTLRDPDDFKTLRKDIFDGVRDEVAAAFPQEHGGVRLELHDLAYADEKEPTLAEQKNTLLKDDYAARRLRGTFRLVDIKTNTPIADRQMTLMRVPYLTERGTFMHGGNEYTSTMQGRLIPGIYSRRQDNGELETQFNVRQGTGVNMRIGFEPDTAQYRLRVKDSNLHLYSLLTDLGIPDDVLAKSWGPELVQQNKAKYDRRVFEKAYDKLVSKRKKYGLTEEPDRDTKRRMIKEALDDMRVSGMVAKKNLPNMFDMAKAASWVKAAAEATDKPDEHIHDKFEPDFTPEQIQDRINDVRGHAGPSLANMREWPSHWRPNSDEHWLEWYKQYHAGRRVEDDETQINRWLRFRRLQVPLFKGSPTPRRFLALRAWAIDGEKLLPPKKLEKLKEDLRVYTQDAQREHAVKSAVFRGVDYRTIAEFLNNEHQAGLNVDAPVDELAQSIMDFVQGEQGVNPGMLDMGLEGLARVQKQEQQALQQIPSTEIKYASHAPLPGWAESFAKQASAVSWNDIDELEQDPKQKAKARREAVGMLTGGALAAGGAGLAYVGSHSMDDKSNAAVTKFLSTANSYPEWYDDSFKPQEMLNRYLVDGSAAMKSSIYGAPLLDHVHAVRDSIAKLKPDDNFAWKSKWVPMPKDIQPYVDLANPAIAPFVQVDPAGVNNKIQESALHYVGFMGGPMAAYRTLWHENGADTAKLGKYLKEWENSIPADERTPDRLDNFYPEFDSFVRNRDRKFWEYKQDMDTSMARDAREAAHKYADLGSGLHQAVTTVPAVLGISAAALGVAGLGYWLHQRLKRRASLRRQQARILKAQLEEEPDSSLVEKAGRSTMDRDETSTPDLEAAGPETSLAGTGRDSRADAGQAKGNM